MNEIKYLKASLNNNVLSHAWQTASKTCPNDHFLPLSFSGDQMWCEKLEQKCNKLTFNEHSVCVRYFCDLILSPHESCQHGTIILIVQMKRSRLREVKELAWGLTLNGKARIPPRSVWLSLYFPSCYNFTSQTCIIFIAIIVGEAEISGQEAGQLLYRTPQGKITF